MDQMPIVKDQANYFRELAAKHLEQKVFYDTFNLEPCLKVASVSHSYVFFSEKKTDPSSFNWEDWLENSRVGKQQPIIRITTCFPGQDLNVASFNDIEKAREHAIAEYAKYKKAVGKKEFKAGAGYIELVMRFEHWLPLRV